jgi:hypothetical protein
MRPFDLFKLALGGVSALCAVVVMAGMLVPELVHPCMPLSLGMGVGIALVGTALSLLLFRSAFRRKGRDGQGPPSE